MEESLISTNYMSKRRSSSPFSSRAVDYSSDEESGWTVYLEDFVSDNKLHKNKTIDHCTFSSFSGWESSSMVSSAACSGTRNQVCGFNDEDDDVVGSSRHERISSKKRKIKSDVVDHELEDTASSPAHSPKVHDLDQLYMNMRSKDMDVSRHFRQEKGSGFDQTGQGIQVGFLGKDSSNNYTQQLRNKGFCLVPMSMLLNYVS